MKKSTAIFCIKLLFGLGLIGLLLYPVDIEATSAIIAEADLRYLALAFIAPHIAILLAAIKWRLFLSVLGIKIHTYRLFLIYMIGALFNNFLPSMMGGDAAKGYVLYREVKKAKEIIASTFMDRFVGLAALVTLLPLMLLIDVISTTIPLIHYIVGGIICGYLCLLALAFFPIFDWLKIRTFKNKWLSIGIDFIKDTHQKVRLFKNHKICLLSTYIISLIFYIFTIATPWLVAKSLSLDIHYLYFAAFVPIVMLVAMIPVSLNGLGVAEAGYTLFLQLAGLPLEQAIAIALILRARLVLTGLIGGVIFIRYRIKQL